MRLIISFLIVATAFSVSAQRDLTPSKRSQAFGSRDLRNLSSTGLQFQLGPTYTFTRRRNIEESFSSGANNGNYTIDPAGRIGGYAEIGLAHFPKKRSGLSLALKTVLVSYYDWGVGFKYIGGKESTAVKFLDSNGDVIRTDEGEGKFYNGYLYGRFSLHKNIHFGGNKNFFLDNSLGVNIDYRIITDDQESDYHNAFSTIYSPGVYYHKPFVAQLHYGLGFGFRLRRGTYLIPGLRTPILGIHEWNKGNPSLKWFSSNYWPVLFHVKIINLFQKRNKSGCPPVDTNDEDRKRNEEFMQGN